MDYADMLVVDEEFDAGAFEGATDSDVVDF